MKKTMLLLAVGALLGGCAQPPAQVADYDVVPLPQTIQLEADAAPFTIKKSTKIVVGADSLMREAQFLQEYVADLTGLSLEITQKCAKHSILVSASLEASNPEAYEISVSKDQLEINGASAAGTFYGIQTLRKSIPDKLIPSIVEFPAATVAGAPRFGYRGAHLDISRHPMEAKYSSTCWPCTASTDSIGISPTTRDGALKSKSILASPK